MHLGKEIAMIANWLDCYCVVANKNPMLSKNIQVQHR